MPCGKVSSEVDACFDDRSAARPAQSARRSAAPRLAAHRGRQGVHPEPDAAGGRAGKFASWIAPAARGVNGLPSTSSTSASLRRTTMAPKAITSKELGPALGMYSHG